MHHLISIFSLDQLFVLFFIRCFLLQLVKIFALNEDFYIRQVLEENAAWSLPNLVCVLLVRNDFDYKI